MGKIGISQLKLTDAGAALLKNSQGTRTVSKEDILKAGEQLKETSRSALGANTYTPASTLPIFRSNKPLAALEKQLAAVDNTGAGVTLTPKQAEQYRMQVASGQALSSIQQAQLDRYNKQVSRVTNEVDPLKEQLKLKTETAKKAYAYDREQGMKAAKAEGVKYAPDFLTTAQKFNVASASNDATGDKLKYIFGPNKEGESWYAAEDAAHAENIYGYLDYLTDEQKNIIRYYSAKGDKEGLDNYLSTIETSLRQKWVDKESEIRQKYAKEHPVLASVAGVGASLLSPIAAPDMIAKGIRQAVTGEYIPTDTTGAQYIFARSASDASQGAQRGAYNDVLEKTGNETLAQLAAKGLALGSSIAENAALITTLGPAAGAAMATIAATQNAYNLLENGEDYGTALVLGVGSGLIEAATEKYSIEGILNMSALEGDTVKDILKTASKNILKQAGIEASEEMVSNVANNALDVLVRMDRAEVNQYAAKLEAENKNMSHEEAMEKALWKYFVEDTIESGIGGAISGGLMSGGAILTKTIGEGMNLREIKEAAQELNFINSTLPEESRVTPINAETATADEVREYQDKVRTAVEETSDIANAKKEGPASMQSNDTKSSSEGPQELNMPQSDPQPTPEVPLESPLNNTISQPTQKRNPGENHNGTSSFGKNTVGAAELNPNSYSAMQSLYGTVPPGENPVRNVDMPKSTDGKNKVSLTPRNAMEAAATPDKLIPTIEQAVAEGWFSYDPISDKAAYDYAKNFIEENEYPAASRYWFEQNQKGRGGKNMTALGWLLYNAAANEGNAKEAVNILTAITESTRNHAQALQAMRMLKKMSPEYQLYHAQVTADRISDRVNKRVGDSDAAKDMIAAIEQTVGTARSEAAQEIGPDIEAGAAGAEFSPGRLQTGVLTPARKSMRRAGKALKEAVSKKYPGADKLNISAEVRKTVRDAGYSMRDIIVRGAQEKAALAQEIAQMLTDSYGLTGDEAQKVAELAADAFNAMVAERTEGKLRRLFKERKRSVPKGLYKRLEALANMGAFSDPRYTKTAAERLFGHANITISPELAQKFTQAQTEEERDMIMDAIYRDIANQVPPSFKDKWDAFRYLAMLGNFRTHMRNMFGNAGFLPVKLAKDASGAVLERLFSKDDRTKSVINFASAKDRALLAVAWNDFKNANKLSLQQSKHDEAKSEIEKYRTIFDGKAGKMLEMLRRVNSEALEWEDAIFKQASYAMSLAGYLKANKVSAEAFESGELPATMVDRGRGYAIGEALKSTYQDINDFSQMVSNLANVAKRGKGSKVNAATNMVIEGILPFKRTPANILARGFEYSPFGLVKGLSDLKKVKTGDKTTSEIMDELSAGLTGTVLVGLGVLLNSLGILVGSSSGDDKEYNELIGQQDYALNIGGTNITLDWLAPEALPVFVGANIAQLARERGDVTTREILTAVSTLANPVLEMSMLQGLQDVIDNAASFQKGESSLISAVVNSVTSLLLQGVPTLFGQIERIGEPYRESTYVNKESWLPDDAQRALAKLFNKIPRFEIAQIDYIDPWGRKESTGNVAGRAFNNLLNPAYVSKRNETEVDKELKRLTDAGIGGMLPQRPSYSTQLPFLIPGTKDKTEKKYLTGEQYETYATVKGQTSYEIINEIIAMRGYKNLADKDKAQLISDAYAYANEIAKESVNAYDNSDGWIDKAQKAEDRNVSPAEYIYYRQLLAEVTESAGETNAGQAETEQALNRMSEFSRQQKAYLWALQNKQWKSENNPYLY